MNTALKNIKALQAAFEAETEAGHFMDAYETALAIDRELIAMTGINEAQMQVACRKADDADTA